MNSDILKSVVVRVFVGENGFVGNATVIQGVNALWTVSRARCQSPAAFYTGYPPRPAGGCFFYFSGIL